VRRWVSFFAPEDVPERAAPSAGPDVEAALEHTYTLLGRLPADERIAFALRFVEQLELTEVARAMGVSAATAKRRLSKGRERFLAQARRDPLLRAWLEERNHGA
jgi:RNA polymerase sigma-70 factor (ECF subfamily)